MKGDRRGVWCSIRRVGEREREGEGERGSGRGRERECLGYEVVLVV